MSLKRAIACLLCVLFFTFWMENRQFAMIMQYFEFVFPYIENQIDTTCNVIQWFGW